jgi:hypothetical protein
MTLSYAQHAQALSHAHAGVEAVTVAAVDVATWQCHHFATMHLFMLRSLKTI